MDGMSLFGIFPVDSTHTNACIDCVHGHETKRNEEKTKKKRTRTHTIHALVQSCISNAAKVRPWLQSRGPRNARTPIRTKTNADQNEKWTNERNERMHRIDINICCCTLYVRAAFVRERWISIHSGVCVCMCVCIERAEIVKKAGNSQPTQLDMKFIKRRTSLRWVQ